MLRVHCVPAGQACPLTHSPGVNAHYCEVGETYSFNSPFSLHVTHPTEVNDGHLESRRG